MTRSNHLKRVFEYEKYFGHRPLPPHARPPSWLPAACGRRQPPHSPSPSSEYYIFGFSYFEICRRYGFVRSSNERATNVFKSRAYHTLRGKGADLYLNRPSGCPSAWRLGASGVVGSHGQGLAPLPLANQASFVGASTRALSRGYTRIQRDIL